MKLPDAYYNPITGRTTTEHPALIFFKQLLIDSKEEQKFSTHKKLGLRKMNVDEKQLLAQDRRQKKQYQIAIRDCACSACGAARSPGARWQPSTRRAGSPPRACRRASVGWWGGVQCTHIGASGRPQSSKRSGGVAPTGGETGRR